MCRNSPIKIPRYSGEVEIGKGSSRTECNYPCTHGFEQSLLNISRFAFPESHTQMKTYYILLLYIIIIYYYYINHVNWPLSSGTSSGGLPHDPQYPHVSSSSGQIMVMFYGFCFWENSIRLKPGHRPPRSPRWSWAPSGTRAGAVLRCHPILAPQHEIPPESRP
jgi:hypothetical protein